MVLDRHGSARPCHPCRSAICPRRCPGCWGKAAPNQVHGGLDDRHFTVAGVGVGRQNCSLRWLNGHLSNPFPQPMPGVDPPGRKWRRGGGDHAPWQDRGKAHLLQRRVFAKPAALGEAAGIRSVGDGTGRFRARLVRLEPDSLRSAPATPPKIPHPQPLGWILVGWKGFERRHPLRQGLGSASGRRAARGRHPAVHRPAPDP